MKRPEHPLTLSVPEAGKKYFGIGRNAAYRAARPEVGQIPVIRIGGLLRVPVIQLERMLAGGGDARSAE